jgi:hypothetical protein
MEFPREPVDTAKRSQALEEAQRISGFFTHNWASDPLSPEVAVRLDVGAEEQPIFVFSLRLKLDDDLDPDEYPRDQIEQLKSDLRARIADSPVDEWDSVVVAGTKVAASQR